MTAVKTAIGFPGWIFGPSGLAALQGQSRCLLVGLCGFASACLGLLSHSSSSDVVTSISLELHFGRWSTQNACATLLGGGSA